MLTIGNEILNVDSDIYIKINSTFLSYDALSVGIPEINAAIPENRLPPPRDILNSLNISNTGLQF